MEGLVGIIRNYLRNIKEQTGRSPWTTIRIKFPTGEYTHLTLAFTKDKTPEELAAAMLSALELPFAELSKVTGAKIMQWGPKTVMLVNFEPEFATAHREWWEKIKAISEVPSQSAEYAAGVRYNPHVTGVKEIHDLSFDGACVELKATGRYDPVMSFQIKK